MCAAPAPPGRGGPPAPPACRPPIRPARPAGGRWGICICETLRSGRARVALSSLHRILRECYMSTRTPFAALGFSRVTPRLPRRLAVFSAPAVPPPAPRWCRDRPCRSPRRHPQGRCARVGVFDANPPFGLPMLRFGRLSTSTMPRRSRAGSASRSSTAPPTPPTACRCCLAQGGHRRRQLHHHRRAPPADRLLHALFRQRPAVHRPQRHAQAARRPQVRRLGWTRAPRRRPRCASATRTPA